MDERFKKCPWLFRKGNTTGQHRQRRSQVRLRMENLIQRLTNNGDVIVQFFCAVASGQPFVMRYVEKLPRTPEQEAVALGIATDLQKAEAKKQASPGGGPVSPGGAALDAGPAAVRFLWSEAV